MAADAPKLRLDHMTFFRAKYDDVGNELRRPLPVVLGSWAAVAIVFVVVGYLACFVTTVPLWLISIVILGASFMKETADDVDAKNDSALVRNFEVYVGVSWFFDIRFIRSV